MHGEGVVTPIMQVGLCSWFEWLEWHIAPFP